MKVNINWCLLLVVFAFCSCSDWLDLKPEGQPTGEELFKDGEGYRSALNGLYQKMGKSSLYGMNLSFGMIDVLSQQYDLQKSNHSQDLYREMMKMNYNDVEVAKKIEETWLDAYRVIANANNLIQNLVRNSSPELFGEGKMEQQMILGEAYACRALMHFDLLRLFAPAKNRDDGQTYIPYVEIYPNIRPQGITVNDCLNMIIIDLEKARELCLAFDSTSLAMNAACSGTGRFHNTFASFTDLAQQPTLLNSFFKGRGYRLNYYSLTALLARVYQYAERYQEAFDYADEVMKYEFKNTYGMTFTFFKFSKSGVTAGSDNSTTAFEAKKDVRLVDNLVFAVYNEKAYDDLLLSTYFAKTQGQSQPNYFVVKQKDIFEAPDGSGEIANDIRATKLIYMANNKYPVSGKWFCHADEVKRKNNVTILPVIRASEMQYIMAEHYARQQNWAEAANILNKMRRERGCSNPVSFSDWPGFVKCLVNDARREWISEGQLFYLYKRLGAEVDFGDGDKHVMKKEEAVLPMPSSQSI